MKTPLPRPPAVSLLSHLDDWRRAAPDAVAVTDYDVHASRSAGMPVVRSRVTVAQLWDICTAVGASLRDRGVRPGDVVAVQLPTWHEYFAAHVAAYAIGAATMPISAVYRTREVARQIESSKASVLIVPAAYGSFDYIAMGSALKRETPTLRHVVVVGHERSHDETTWDELVAKGRELPEREQVARGDHALPLDSLMLLNFTSGTTGVPKGVMHSVATVSAAVHDGIERMQLTPEDVLLIAVTLGHAGGFLNGIHMPLLLKARAVYMDLWDAGIALDIIERERVSYGPMMPTFLFDLIRHERFDRTDIRSWKKSRVSGGSISRSVMATLQERLPDLKLLPGWGLSEALYITCAGPDDPQPKRTMTDGRPLRGAHVEIRDSTFEQRLDVNVDGKIVVHAPSVMLGYYLQDDLTRAAFTKDGWLKTGDLGHLDEDGYLLMVGRSKEIIVRGGENVPAVELEHLLMEHEKVAGVAVVGVPDPRLGEKVCAVVQCKDGAAPLTLDEMRNHLVRRELTRQFIPEYLVLVDSLPRTSVGKIRKHEVRRLIRDELAPIVQPCLHGDPMPHSPASCCAPPRAATPSHPTDTRDR